MSSTRLLFLIVLGGLGCVLNVNCVHQHLNPWADIVSNVKIFQKLLMIPLSRLLGACFKFNVYKSHDIAPRLMNVGQNTVFSP